MLCYLVDLASIDGVSPDEQLKILQHEVGNYRPELLERPSLIVGTKIDSAEADVISAWPHMKMSSITTENVRSVVNALAQTVSEARQAEPVMESTIIMRPEPEHSWVEQLGENEYRVHGRAAERVVALNDVTTPVQLLGTGIVVVSLSLLARYARAH